jgi:hypothetical protein
MDERWPLAWWERQDRRQRRYGDRSFEAQLNRASALSLVINAIIVWNTRYLAAAADELARRGQPIPDTAWTHLTPCCGEHVHFVGAYRFEEPVIVGSCGPWRPFREPMGATPPPAWRWSSVRCADPHPNRMHGLESWRSPNAWRKG